MGKILKAKGIHSYTLAPIAHKQIGCIYRSDATNGAHRLTTLRKRVVQHNLRIVSLYYTRAETKRLMTLLALSQNELETELSELVIDKMIITGRINPFSWI